MSIQNRLENVKSIVQAKEFVLFLNKCKNDVLVTNQHVFYALSQKKEYPFLVRALYESKKNMSGPSCKIQKELQFLLILKQQAENMHDYSSFCDVLYEFMLDIEKYDLRICNDSLKFAKTHFFEFPRLIEVMTIYNHDLFDFASFSNALKQ